MMFWWEKKRCNLSSFIVLRKKHIFLTWYLWVFLSEICVAITTRAAFTRSVSAISQNANLKTGERQMSASNPMHSSGNSHPPVFIVWDYFDLGISIMEKCGNSHPGFFGGGFLVGFLVRIGSAFMWGFFFADPIRILIFAAQKKPHSSNILLIN